MSTKKNEARLNNFVESSRDIALPPDDATAAIARSRAKLITALMPADDVRRAHHEHSQREPVVVDADGDAHANASATPSNAIESGVVFRALGKAVSEHPVAQALVAAQPIVRAAATSRPWAVLGIAALAGAAVIAARPWRFVAMSALLASASKSMLRAPVVASAVMSFVDESTKGKPK
jgi:hypothetical protein